MGWPRVGRSAEERAATEERDASIICKKITYINVCKYLRSGKGQHNETTYFWRSMVFRLHFGHCVLIWAEAFLFSFYSYSVSIFFVLLFSEDNLRVQLFPKKKSAGFFFFIK